MKNDPAYLVPKALGGAKATGLLVGKTKSAVHRWSLPKTKGGAEGRVPASNIFPIWCALIERGSALSLEELVFTADERAAIAELRQRTGSLASPETIGDET
jgi:hypothetical protein